MSITGDRTPHSLPATISGRFETSLTFDDKPDTKPNLGSPISTLRPQTTPTTSSSSSSNSTSSAGNPDFSGRTNHSSELPTTPQSRSGPLIYSGSASSPSYVFSPEKASKPSVSDRRAVLGSGTGNYGHGSIMKGKLGETGRRKGVGSLDPEEAMRAGNEMYRMGKFGEALVLYERAVSMWPENSKCRGNRAAALLGMGRLGDAARECEEALRLDPANYRVTHRLGCIRLRLGDIENARKHLFLTGEPADQVELQKVQEVEGHFVRCEAARKIGEWKSTLREADAAIKVGVDSSPMLAAARAEALLHLHQIDEADTALSDSAKIENSSAFFQSTKFFGMLSDSYFYVVRARVDMALGRFENAVAAAEKAKQIDARSIEIAMLLSDARSVARARTQGNELFKMGDFSEACTAYSEGLKFIPSNPVLLCNRAACRSNLGQWEKSVEDCNEALRIRPNYTKALLRRATSNAKLEHWSEAVRDYEFLRKELPGDNEIAEALFHAQVALKTSRGEVVSNIEFGHEIEVITSVEQFDAAISSLPGVSVVYFMADTDQQCSPIFPFVKTLCTRYPSANFLKVDINKSPLIAKTQSVKIVPTFKIYKNGTRVEEMICPSNQILEYSVRHYTL